MNNFFNYAKDALQCDDVATKISLVNSLQSLLKEPDKLSFALTKVEKILVPGRPAKPELVLPKNLVRRKLSSDIGKAALVHAIAHIEFNAINLALDAAYRFQNMPLQFYIDWLKVASEECKHFNLLVGYLATINYQYGDFPAHNGLWEMAVTTDHDALTRMALVPRVLEARGLDVTPDIRKKFQEQGVQAVVDILDIIERDEICHVAIGNHWYHSLCQQQGLDPIDTFRQLINQHAGGTIKPPLAKDSRYAAGFTSQDIQLLEEYL